MNLANRPRLMVWMLIVLSACCVGFAGLWLKSESELDAHRDGLVCEQVVREMGDRARDVAVRVSTHPKAILNGFVAQSEDRDALEKNLKERLGQRYNKIGFAVTVKDQNEPRP